MSNRLTRASKWLTLISAVIATMVVMSLMINPPEGMKAAFALVLILWMVLSWTNYLVRIND